MGILKLETEGTGKEEGRQRINSITVYPCCYYNSIQYILYSIIFWHYICYYTLMIIINYQNHNIIRLCPLFCVLCHVTMVKRLVSPNSLIPPPPSPLLPPLPHFMCAISWMKFDSRLVLHMFEPKEFPIPTRSEKDGGCSMGGEEVREGIGGGRSTHHFSPPLYRRPHTTNADFLNSLN